MVENPIENEDLRVVQLVRQQIIEMAMEEGFPLAEAERQAKELLEPCMLKPSLQELTSK